MRRLLSLKWIASHLFVVIAVVGMAGLGLWQLNRLDTRREANEAIRSLMSEPPVDIAFVAPPAAVGTAETAKASDLEGVRSGRREDSGQGGIASRGGARPAAGSSDASDVLPDHSVVTASGVYRDDAEVLIGHRSFRGRPGMWLSTPLELQDGRLVLVVRGWVPRSGTAPGFDAEAAAPPVGEVTVTGLAFSSRSGGRVAVAGPDDIPELSRVDLSRFEEVTGLGVMDMWIRLLEQSPAQAALPVPVPVPDLDDGPHLSYAFQWFSFSAGAAVVYALILRRAVCGRSRSHLKGPVAGSRSV